ncbi:MAG: S8 family serine peptidase [Campylobacterales bacterium]|nr:S8 family serine peptidase [Campylobacterales bacterium]
MRNVIYFLLFAFGLMACGGGESSVTPTSDDDDTTSKYLVDRSLLYDGKEAKLQDPYRQYLWHIETPSNTSFRYNYSIDQDASANIAKAWELTKGEGVLIAIIDNGFDVEHEDLKDNIVLTYNVADDNSDVSNEDSSTHGTAATGIIIASSNETGTIGVAPKAKIVLIKDHELSTDSDMVKAFEYAQKSGARVVSCSWGTNNVSDVVASKIQELYDDGIVVVFASGNDGMSLDRYGIDDESELAYVIGVGSSSEFNTRSSYSSYGERIDILAPAGEYIGIVATDDYGANQIAQREGILANGYTFFNGTSAAAPIVSGVVALMLSVNPDLTPAQVREIIISNAQKIGGVEYIAGWNRKYAYGKIDAYKAVLAAREYKK